MRFSQVITLFLSLLALAACANKPAAPPAIAYDADNFKQAVVQTEPEEKSVADGDIPAPPPEIAPPGPAKPDAQPPIARVSAANKAALQEPTKSGYLNAVQRYQFNEGALYHLYAAPEQVTDIALEPGESLSAVSAGDTVRWVIGDTSSGNGPGRRVHVLVKPFAPDLHTNLVIATDRRSYHLQLDSTAGTAMAVVSWSYPEDAIAAAKRRIADAKDVVERKVDLENVKFRYAISGDTPPWKPVRAFDDTNKVYIEFPGRIDQGEAPPLFVVGPSGNSELVNYRVKGNYYIVDRLFAAAELRLGQKPQQVVRMSRTDTVAASSSKENSGG